MRARTSGLTAADVDRALTEERSLVIDTLNRGTLHMVRSEDHRWLHALTAPRLATGNARRLAQEGVSPDAADRGVAAIERALEDEGPLTRARLRERIAAAGVRTEGQALPHILALASLRGLILRGPMHGREQAFALVRDWLGAPNGPVDREIALAELARRYLAGHGPAAAGDLARWSGLPLRDARGGLSAIAPELEQLDGGLVALARQPPAADPPRPRLLGAFEPLLLGWTSRDEILDPAERARVTSNGLFRPFALVRARAVATWALRDGQLTLQPFKRIARRDAATLERDAADVTRFLDR